MIHCPASRVTSSRQAPDSPLARSLTPQKIRNRSKLLVILSASLGASSSLFPCSGTPSYSDISAYADQLSAQFKVPAVIIKAIIEQESRWDATKISSDGGIGLMQITPLPNQTQFELGSIDSTHSNGANPFRIVTTFETVDLYQLRNDWCYNMQIGVRILLAKTSHLNAASLDLRILENWYYPLTYYNGAAAYNGSNADTSNDPINPVYSRNPSSNNQWVSKQFFPYQECVFNIIAQKYTGPRTK